MKTRLTLLFATLLFIAACNNSNTDKAAASSNSISTDNKEQSYPHVTAKINGKPWQSIKDEILATYSDFDDKLQIFTKDADGKMNFLLMFAPFSKTNVGAYNSVREGAGGYGISLLDENTKDDIALDYDNFHQGAVAGCLNIVSIKETAEGKIVEGSFASPMNVSNNYDASKKKIEITEGSFAVLIKK
jgi:hypothetical protein